MPESPFESVESAHGYVALLQDTVRDARKEVQKDIGAAATKGDDRQLQALRLVDHQLNLLSVHLRAISRILNDLRMLRRVLLSDADQE